jgi:peptide/nickel transport system ATP-binding protein
LSELRFETVTVRYGTLRRGLTAVDRVDLTIPSGTTAGLVGESGSGKSTLARAATGLVPLERGRILLDGEPIAAVKGRHPVQMVFQDPNSSLDPRMTIGESIGEALSGDLTRGQRREEVARLLELVHVDPARADGFPGQLSGGQRQRVALARALGSRPEVLIADEVTAALDVSIQGAVLNLIRDLQRELKLTVLYISHNLAVVRYVASHIAVMYSGQIVEFGTRTDVLERPQHPYTRDLLASIPGTTSGDVSAPLLETVEDLLVPTGCRYHPRCPIGPLVHPERFVCLTDEPSTKHRNMATCHFADPPSANPAK